MRSVPLRFRLLAQMPHFTWPYINILLVLVGSDIHFHHADENNEERERRLIRRCWPLFKLIGRIKLRWLG